MENSIMLTIAVGSVSGVVSAGVLWFLKYLFTDKVLPFYQATVYKGSSIQGKWEAYIYEEGKRSKLVSTIEIRQSAHKIEAKYIMIFDDTSTLEFDCEGEYWEGYLSLIGRSNLNTNYNIITVLFRQRDSGGSLRGDICTRHRIEDKPFSTVDVIFEREVIKKR
jgi:hypothetical protein